MSHSSLSNLLQQPTVTAIHRDKSGLLWIGTQQGLHQFDGAKVTIFSSGGIDKTHIPNSDIKDIAEDINGNLLVATSGGVLLRWDTQREMFDAITQFGSANNEKLVRLLVTKNGSIWLLTKNGLVFYNSRFDSPPDWMRQLDLTERIGAPQDILETDSGDIWVSGGLGLVKIDMQKMEVATFDLAALGIKEESSITKLHQHIANNLIIGTSEGELAIWDENQKKLLAYTKLERNYISALQEHQGMLIIGTDRGVFVTDNRFEYAVELSNGTGSTSDRDIYSMFADGEHLWVGTINGLRILSFSPFELYNSLNGGVYNDVLAFDEDNKGRIWVGTYAGLYLFDPSTRYHTQLEIYSDTANIPNPKISTIFARKDKLWLGIFQNGAHIANISDGSSLTSNKLTGIPNTTITKILKLKGIDGTWIATYTQGLYFYASKATKSYYTTNSLPEKSITTLFQSNTGILFAVAENKIYIHDPETDQFSKKPFDFGLPGKMPSIYSFGESHNKDIWIGTKDHGLFLWSRTDQLNNRFHLNPAKGGVGLATSTIYGIEIDSAGNLWCSTQNGILKLDPEGRLVKRFTETDGLQGNDFSFGASFTSQDGLIYFGGVNGYNRFDPAEVTIDDAASEMRLTGISLPKNKQESLGPISELKSLELTHKDYFATFEFSVLDFIHPERNQFRYRLENFDPDWVNNGTRNTATYTNLPAGDFTLRIEGANSAGIWNREGITLNIRVLPAPWFTWWAYCIYGFLILLLFWGLTRIYQSFEAKRQSKRLEEQMFEAENRADDDMQEQLELQDELVHSASQHNQAILTLMNDCMQYQSNSLPSDIRQYLTSSNSKKIAALSSLEDFLFYQAGGPAANMKGYADYILTDLLKHSPVEPPTIVTINEVSPKLIPTELALPLAITIYELLENSIQHAFPQDSPANYIHIGMTHNCDFYPSEYHVELSVRDSGTTEPAAIESLARENSGLSIVRSIVEKLNGTLEFSTDTGIKVTLIHPSSEDADLEDEDTNSG